MHGHLEQRTPALDEADLRTLRQAKEALEDPSFLARVADLLGAPLEQAIALLPANAADKVQAATRAALHKAMHVALSTVDAEGPRRHHDDHHKLAAAVTGAVGGAFGLLSLPVELPVSTTILLRSIIDIAHSEGEDIHSLPTQLACLEVFALGGASSSDDATDAGYFGVRASLAKLVSDAATYVGKVGLSNALGDAAAPALAKLIARISARYGPVVMNKVAAAAVPLIGAGVGSTVNVLFTNHFQSMAHAHFAVRRLEREYGAEAVRAAYEVLGTGSR